MTRPRVLFVDDEPQVLDALENCLRKKRNEWDLVFALGGSAAATELGRAPFDVIVSDLRMPGLDGASFLQVAREACPGAVRIVLSGQAERETVRRTLPVAHQFLAKPCEPQALRNVIGQALRVSACLANPTVRDLVGKMDKLPSVPEIYTELSTASENPNVSAPELARICEKDPAITAKVLQLVNSAFFGLRQATASIEQAVGYLGSELLRGLVLTAHVFTSAGSPPPDILSIARLQEHSLLTAQLARRFLRGRTVADEAFTAGLLHDIGRLALSIAVPDEMRAIRTEMAATGEPLHVIERRRLSTSHTEVGAFILGGWGLPFSLVEAVEHHETPGMFPDGDLLALAAVHVADALTDHLTMDGARAPAQPLLDAAFIQRAGLADSVPVWLAIAQHEFRAIRGGDAPA